MPLTLRLSKDADGQTVRVHPAGSLDSTTAPTLERELSPLVAGALTVLVLDMEGVTFVSSAGIRVILAARKRMADRKGSLLIANLQPPVAKAFEIVRAIPDMNIFRNTDELDDYLAAMQRKAGGPPR
ncbi:MAG TPA: STAS domain-containing protein [Methylomirabilota bacterium]|nr:STAS domain-containing protein [Methylomirabilota bacterium]